ncbi:MAG: hypothetical protein Q4C53_03680 [Clostridia bacterium]|nr:hypothetical protein [Clostridia bacterium]
MENTKTLETIQKLSKAGRILSKIVFICCVIGMIGCAVGGISLALIPDGLTVGNIHIIGVHGLIEMHSGLTLGTIFSSILAGAILCAGEAALAGRAERYFRNELANGTPFTRGGAKELMQLGILCIWVPVVTFTLAVIAHEVIAHWFPSVWEVPGGILESVALGIAFIVSSLLCRFGAELTEDK